MTHMASVLPKITSAAGVIGPAKVLVMGLGVAGLEAIATAQRLGAVVEGYDIRPATEGAGAVAWAPHSSTPASMRRGKGGYARALTAEEKTKVDAALTKHIQGSDLIITTAAIPGKASPKLISKSAGRRHEVRRGHRRSLRRRRRQLRGHKPGRDHRGRRRDDRRAPERSVAARRDASELYAKNQYKLLALMMKDNIITIDWTDEVLAKTALTHDGKLCDTGRRHGQGRHTNRESGLSRIRRRAP